MPRGGVRPLPGGWRQLICDVRKSISERQQPLKAVAEEADERPTGLYEIADWLRRHGAGEPFVVIDDDYSGIEVRKTHMQCIGTSRQPSARA